MALGFDAPGRHMLQQVYAAAVDDILATGEVRRFLPRSDKDEIAASLDRPAQSFREVYAETLAAAGGRSRAQIDAELSRVYKRGWGR